MTTQEAYNLGLTNAENVVIEKLQAYLDGKEATPFNNPELEEVRQKLLKNQKSNTSTIFDDRFISKLESSIKYSPERRNWSNTEFEDERINNLFKSWLHITDYLWNVSKYKHASAKVVKRILKESEEMIKNSIDLEEIDDKF